METHFWTLFWILLAAGVSVTLGVIPYSLAINPGVMVQLKARLAEKGSRLPAEVVIVLTSLVQASLIIAIAIYFGLLTARAVGLRLPLLEAMLDGGMASSIFLSGLPFALLVGFIVGAVIIALENFFFQPRLPAAFHDVKTKQAFWKRALACFYGGIYEELLLRLFILSGLIWLIGLAWPASVGQINIVTFWIANIIAAVLFGVGHLPATARIAPLTPLIIMRALILNGIAGLFFGVLFLVYGLECAILAHFCMDIMMHLVLPELMAGRGAKANA